MLGFVRTPPHVVDMMVADLFGARPPTPGTRLLDPGCGEGDLIAGVIRWCEQHGSPLPQITGVEVHPERSRAARRRFDPWDAVRIVTGDFLRGDPGAYDFVLSNPPYVAITELAEDAKARYRDRFATATGRFDLYLLFWEQALGALRPGGRLVFITPEKYLTVESARSLRCLLARADVQTIRMLPEDTFEGLTTYPTVTVVQNTTPQGSARLHLRDDTCREVPFSEGGDSLAPHMYAEGPLVDGDVVLDEACLRVSCGIATGGDRHFVQDAASLPPELRAFAHPTVSGRQLVHGEASVQPVDAMLIPYTRHGTLMNLADLGPFAAYLEARKDRLLERSCTRRKPWYAFHETPRLDELLRPKILCKDVAEEPYFWVDEEGEIVPRHSVYYIIPREPSILADLARYLNGPEARAWLMAHCQRVRKGFIRLQSTVLKQLPIPRALALADRPPLFAAASTS
jgi:SAM-dependent methyltransferase